MFNDIVDLIATLDPSWTAGSWTWSGACSGDTDCAVVMDQHQAVDIRFHCELIRIAQPAAPIDTPLPAWECGNLEAVDGFQIVAGGKVTFDAQDSIVLGNGFEVGSGAVFRAVLAP